MRSVESNLAVIRDKITQSCKKVGRDPRDIKIIAVTKYSTIERTKEAMEAGIEDCLNSEEICMVEWPEKAPEIFPDKTIFSHFEIVSATKRKLVIQLPA